MSNNIKNINDFVRRSAEKQKTKELNSREASKQDIVQGAIQAKKIVEMEFARKGNGKLLRLSKPALLLSSIGLIIFCSVKYVDFYNNQMKDIKSCYLKNPDVYGRISKNFDESLRQGTLSPADNAMSPDEKSKIIGILEKIPKEPYEISSIRKFENNTDGGDNGYFFNVSCLTRENMIVFLVSYSGRSCKILRAESTPNKFPVDL